MERESVSREELETEGVAPSVITHLIGFKALEEYLVPLDPMDDLQCESCQ